MCFTSYLGERGYELPVAHGVWVVQSEWPSGLVDVSGGQVGVGLQDAWLPHCQRGGAQVAEGAQVQVSRVACAESDFDHHGCFFIEVANIFLHFTTSFKYVFDTFITNISFDPRSALVIHES